MGYYLKEEIAKEIREKYKNSYIINKTGISQSLVSLILHRKRHIPKKTAYSFTKVINSEYEIEDLFERV